MCNCSATALVIEMCRAEEGLEYVPLSGGDLYHRISGGVDRGSTLEDGIEEAMKNGVASTAVVPYLQWRSNVSGAPEDRKRFKVLEAYLCPTFDHCMSAVLRGFKLVTGILWGNNYNPDRDGWIPSRAGGIEGGHAIGGYKGTYRGDTYGIWHSNSWGNWGPFNGRFVIPEGCYTGSIGGWWSIRSSTTESGDVPSPVGW